MEGRVTVMTPPTWLTRWPLNHGDRPDGCPATKQVKHFPSPALRVSRQIYMIEAHLEQPSGASREEWALCEWWIGRGSSKRELMFVSIKETNSVSANGAWETLRLWPHFIRCHTHTVTHKDKLSFFQTPWNCPHGLQTSRINRTEVLSIKIRRLNQVRK